MQYAFNTTLRNTQSTGRVKFKGYIISNPDSHCAGITSGGLAKAFFLGTNGAGPGKGYVRWNFCETAYISAGSSITLNYQYMHLGRGNAPGIIISGNMLSETGWLGNPKYDFGLYVQTTSAQPVSVRVYDGGYLTIEEERENREIRVLSDYDGLCHAIDKELSTRSAGYATNLPSRQKTLDVSDWAREPYDRAWNNGLILKYMERGFMTDKITREQFCDMLILLLQKQGAAEGEPSGETNFSDTRNEDVLALAQKGIIRGKSDTVFAPNDFLTREEAATILQRTLGCLGADVQKPSDLTFSDDADISDWAKEAVYALNGEGILLGTAENNFSPKSNFTKEQTVATVLRIYDRLREEKTADEES